MKIIIIIIKSTGEALPKSCKDPENFAQIGTFESTTVFLLFTYIGVFLIQVFLINVELHGCCAFRWSDVEWMSKRRWWWRTSRLIIILKHLRMMLP